MITTLEELENEYRKAVCGKAILTVDELIDITRQIIMHEEDEPYQLSLVFIYDPAAFMSMRPYDTWSDYFNSIDDFICHIKTTPGYELACKTKARRMQLHFGQC